ncbi:hypothetical protein JHN55_22870 [Streptomyces sp. MBT56]|uniref:hypothetical protein n=2 Tax=Streptomyces TaxID=1883 RepID=UPI001909E02D|nr:MULTISPECIES: hypothetical protein [unclassified Streptomyces]MBK3559315.1 hypothetical protein [Streptomyces sp. MBT56]MBK3613944.1 hypothetical protein [Streptomyces sp. MBT98]MBK6041991.1 hypothetical protein [Streptomyces sp. MBT55]
MRFLSGRGVTLTHTFLDDEESMIVPAVSVTVRDATGRPVYTGDATSSGDAWTTSLPAQPEGVYTVDWTAEGLAVDRDGFEVVGGFLFTLPEARGSDMDLEDRERFPTAELRHYREVVEDEFETITARSFVPRTARVEVEADGSAGLHLGYFDVTGLQAVYGPSGAEDVSLWAVDRMGFVWAPYDLPEGSRYTVTFVYGFGQVPEDVKRAGLLRLRSVLTAERSGIPDRATAFVAAEGGNFTLATAGRNGYETGIPEVDATLSRYKYRIFYDVLGVSR